MADKVYLFYMGIHPYKTLVRTHLVAWHSGRTPVSDRRTFPVPRSICIDGATSTHPIKLLTTQFIDPKKMKG